MVGRLRKAKELAKEFPKIKKSGDKFRLRNSDGRPVSVDADQLIYNRGKNRFGIYSEDRDSNRKGNGYDALTLHGRIGSGDRRQQSDKMPKRKRG